MTCMGTSFVPFSKFWMRVRGFTKACERKLFMQLYEILSGCINTDARFKISIKTRHIARKVVRLPLCQKSPKFIMNAMQVNVDYSTADITRECAIFYGYGNLQQHYIKVNVKT